MEMQDKAGVTLLRVGPEGRLSYTLNHSTYPDVSEPQVPVQHHLRLTLLRPQSDNFSQAAWNSMLCKPHLKAVPFTC